MLLQKDRCLPCARTKDISSDVLNRYRGGGSLEVENHEAIISGSDQSGRNFSGVNFGESRNLRNVNFTCANLSGASFSNGYLGAGEVHTKHHIDNACYPSNLSKSDFTSADLSKSNLYGCSLVGADLSDACVERADLGRSNCAHIVAVGTSFKDAYLSGACFDGAQCEGASFVGVKCGPDAIGENTKYSGQATLGAATFCKASLCNVDCSGADLQGVDFSGSNIDGAIFNGANLRDAIFPNG